MVFELGLLDFWMVAGTSRSTYYFHKTADAPWNQHFEQVFEVLTKFFQIVSFVGMCSA